ncbi:hypothetical protein FA13DRAFT_1727835 [Coprinellus micaceus]|uniref:Uncharacterized protein n=1 Tax=Coprinellus micaceus TaxID=71717 RepID=A0A4Y7TQL4_COPMI|nr:hypothetical protein FA13DRAFT_1727835 [Coprinellus micaceus]
MAWRLTAFSLSYSKGLHIHTTWAGGGSDERRESTYVRVRQVTLNGKEVDTVWYGRVMSIMAVDLPGDRNVYGKCAGKTHLLAVVQPCNTGQKDARKELVAYKDYAQPVAIDLNHITALVGRAKSRNQWHILDRFEDCALAAFDGHEERGEGVEDDGADQVNYQPRPNEGGTR